MSELESYKVVTVDQGYHVYVAVWEAAVGQMVPYQQKADDLLDTYAVAVVEKNDILVDNDAPTLNKNF